MWRAHPKPAQGGPFRFPACLDEPARPDASLRLVTVHARGYTNGQDLRQAGPPEVLPDAAFSPDDAKRLELREGQAVTLANTRGTFAARVRLDSGMAPGTVVVEQAAEGLNVLVSPETTPRGHSCINETWVDVVS
jgi:anaerobic selenocysteine-containing dehydrogenase